MAGKASIYAPFGGAHGGFATAESGVTRRDHARARDVGRTAAAGYRLHVPKPIDPRKLISAVRTAGA